ncbi:hypothetical protein Purlil1_5586 [Purpureocillium lilacinum]|uniref:Uncharacterized protein n=1 Tax=Purpureocillium lilacinum TaxID=33203 RepID=A0ABR0C169_PURLI|nr:hypothetical protein Purlil1_5586 [Purpureocillium lilacinum]
MGKDDSMQQCRDKLFDGEWRDRRQELEICLWRVSCDGTPPINTGGEGPRLTPSIIGEGASQPARYNRAERDGTSQFRRTWHPNLMYRAADAILRNAQLVRSVASASGLLAPVWQPRAGQGQQASPQSRDTNTCTSRGDATWLWPCVQCGVQLDALAGPRDPVARRGACESKAVAGEPETHHWRTAPTQCCRLAASIVLVVVRLQKQLPPLTGWQKTTDPRRKNMNMEGARWKQAEV